MPSLTIKNLPPEIHQRLKDSARLNRRSVNSEAIVRLEQSLGHGRRPLAETLASIQGLHERLKDLPPLDDAFLDRAKNEGRP
jgi:plasmid stability protein